MELLSQFKKSLEKHNINYDTYNIIPKPETKTAELKKLVLPASKLQPLPPDFVIRGGKWPLARPLTVPKLKVRFINAIFLAFIYTKINGKVNRQCFYCTCR